MLFNPKFQKALRGVFIVFAILLALSMALAFTPIFGTGGY